MLQILVSPLVFAGSAAALAVALGGCGQQGVLYLPTEPAAAKRATLPETLGIGPSKATPNAPTAPTTPSSPAPK